MDGHGFVSKVLYPSDGGRWSVQVCKKDLNNPTNWQDFVKTQPSGNVVSTETR